MLSVHGLVKILNREAIAEFTGSQGNFFTIKLSLVSNGKNRNGSDKEDIYPAIVYFFDKESAEQWSEQLKQDRYIDIRWATLDGVKVGNNGKEFGSVRVRLYPDIRHTVPL